MSKKKECPPTLSPFEVELTEIISEYVRIFDGNSDYCEKNGGALDLLDKVDDRARQALGLMPRTSPSSLQTEPLSVEQAEPLSFPEFVASQRNPLELDLEMAQERIAELETELKYTEDALTDAGNNFGKSIERIAKLEAENARLQQDLSDARQTMSRMLEKK